jgi:hypothetical protein
MSTEPETPFEPKELTELRQQLDSVPPWSAVAGFILGRSQVLAAQLKMLYERIRDGKGKYAVLPEMKDEESAKLVDRCFRLLASSIDKNRESSDKVRKDYLTIWCDYQAHYLLYVKMLEIKKKTDDLEALAAPIQEKEVDEEDDADDEQRSTLKQSTATAPRDIVDTSATITTECSAPGTETKQSASHPESVDIYDDGGAATAAHEAPQPTAADGESMEQPSAADNVVINDGSDSVNTAPAPRRSVRARKTTTRK